MIQAFTRYIAANTALTIGTDLYAGHRPSNAPDACDVVLDRIGPITTWNRASRFQLSLQVLSRASSYFAASERAQTIHELFDGMTGLILLDGAGVPQYKLDTCQARGPASIGQDDLSRFEFSTNYDCRVSRL